MTENSLYAERRVISSNKQSSLREIKISKDSKAWENKVSSISPSENSNVGLAVRLLIQPMCNRIVYHTTAINMVLHAYSTP